MRKDTSHLSGNQKCYSRGQRNSAWNLLSQEDFRGAELSKLPTHIVWWVTNKTWYKALEEPEMHYKQIESLKLIIHSFIVTYIKIEKIHIWEKKPLRILIMAPWDKSTIKCMRKTCVRSGKIGELKEGSLVHHKLYTDSAIKTFLSSEIP